MAYINPSACRRRTAKLNRALLFRVRLLLEEVMIRHRTYRFLPPRRTLPHQCRLRKGRFLQFAEVGESKSVEL